MINIGVLSTFLETQGITQLIAIGSLFVSFFSLYYARKAYLANKTKAITEKRQERYDLLNQSVFNPIHANLIAVTSQKDNLPFIRIGEYSTFDYVDEGLEHLKKNVKNFIKRVDSLRKNTDEYKKSHDSFRENEISSIIQEFLMKNNYSIGENPESNESNTIIISNLLDLLYAYWYCDIEYDIRRRDNRLEAPMNAGLTTIAMVSDENLQSTMQSINQLKEHNLIVSGIKAYRETVNKIISDADNLKKEIKSKIIDKISKKEYNTKCKFCKKIK